MSKTLVFDIETNGLLLDCTVFHVGYTYCRETKQYTKFLSANEMVKELNTATTIIGHNILGFDIPALNKLATINVRDDVRVVDTLILAKLAYYDQDKSWKHSLDAYGERLGAAKGKHTDFSTYTEEMAKYCKQDVLVNEKLYQHLLRKTAKWIPPEALEIEQEVQKIITKQYVHGWLFDVNKARKLHIELVEALEKAELELHTTFKPMILRKGQAKIPKRPFFRNGVLTTGEWYPVELTIFNPGSGKHIVHWVETLYGKQSWCLTEKGTPKTDADTLMEMFSDRSWAKPLLHYLEVKKLLGQLAEGNKAWLRLVKKDNRLHGSADILGTVTGRFTHSDPNLAQVPSVRAFKGKEARSLFTVPRGYVQIGCDASGLELRTLSHYLARYDNGTYGRTVLEADIHTANQQAAGLPTRDAAKTFIYAFLYGAGDAKIGTIVNGTAKEGGRLKRTFLSKTKGLNMLVKAVKEAAKRGYLVGLSGRRLYVRSPHSALNTLLQSAGAYVMKYYLVELNRLLTEANVDFKFIGNIHDEVQIEVKETDKDIVSHLAEYAFSVVTEQLKFRCKLEGEAKIGSNWADTH